MARNTQHYILLCILIYSLDDHEKEPFDLSIDRKTKQKYYKYQHVFP